MAIKRRRFDANSAHSEGLAYLLRQQERLKDATYISRSSADGYVFRGPIESAFFVCATNTRPGLRNVADFICDGSDDQIEIIAAFDSAPGPDYATRVVLSPGTFYLTDTIAIPPECTLQGSGKGLTILEMESSTWQFAGNAVFDMYAKSTVRDLSIITTGGS